MNTIEIADRDDLTITVETVIGRLKALKITTTEEYASAAEFVKKVKETAKIIEKAFEPEYREKYGAYKSLLDERSFYTDKLTAAEKTIKSQMAAFSTAQETKAREEARARLKAEQEAQSAASAMGLTAQESIVPSVVSEPPANPVKAAGVTEVVVWKYEVENFDILPNDYKIANEQKLGAIVRASGELTNIQGIRVFSEKQIRVRT